LNNLNMLK